ncbi:MAG: GNAT family N-acetyltransferase [SAR324 cluster bacterium]|nr:GNAT family N-acetyltransferase [SAR324 cluster bacterium]
MSQHPRLKTERLLLRKLTLRDADTISSSYAQDEEVTRYLPWKLHLKKNRNHSVHKAFFGRLSHRIVSKLDHQKIGDY